MALLLGILLALAALVAAGVLWDRLTRRDPDVTAAAGALDFRLDGRSARDARVLAEEFALQLESAVGKSDSPAFWALAPETRRWWQTEEKYLHVFSLSWALTRGQWLTREFGQLVLSAALLKAADSFRDAHEMDARLAYYGAAVAAAPATGLRSPDEPFDRVRAACLEKSPVADGHLESLLIGLLPLVPLRYDDALGELLASTGLARRWRPARPARSAAAAVARAGRGA